MQAQRWTAGGALVPDRRARPRRPRRRVGPAGRAGGRAALATLLLGAAAPPAHAVEAHRTVDPTTISCSDVVRLTEAERTRVALWLDGMLKATRWGPTDERGDTALGRPLRSVFEVCAAEPGRAFLDVWVQRYPGGKTDVQPLVVTCAEWTNLAPGLRAQVVAWNEGYASVKRPSGAPGFAAPRARDLAPVTKACASSPKRRVGEVLQGLAGPAR